MGTAGRRYFVPEVVQTSQMDCGPASLKSLLEGFRISVSYGRLREACQTDVDGTSINTLEDIANALGLEAEQIIVPLDHLLLEGAGALPAIVVVRLASGLTHFVVVWSTLAGVVQVMDPGTGRRWPSREPFLRDVHLHSMTISATAWRDYATSDEFLDPLRARMRAVGAGNASATAMVDHALGDPSGRAIAGLDAAVRLVEAVARARGWRRGREAVAALSDLFDQLQRPGAKLDDVVPLEHWFARPNPQSASGEDSVAIRGAVVIRIAGARAAPTASDASEDDAEDVPRALSPELAAALNEPPSRPLRDLLGTLRSDGLLTPTAVVLGLALAAGGTVLEAVLLRALFDVGRQIGVADRRAWAFAAFVFFLGLLLLVEWPIEVP